MQCELPLVIPQSFSDKRILKKTEHGRPACTRLMPCRETNRIQAKNSKMAHPHHFKLISENIFNFQHAPFQMSLAASGYYENKNGKFQTTWQQQRELVDKGTVLIHSQKTCVRVQKVKKNPITCCCLCQDYFRQDFPSKTTWAANCLKHVCLKVKMFQYYEILCKFQT